MPSGLKRYYGAGDLHFITCSCYHRQPLLGTPKRRDLLLTVLEQVRIRYRLAVLGYVVMPEHFHLLITEPEVGTPSTSGAVLLQGHAHVWQRRFYDFNLCTEHKRIEKLRYIHRNPVARGLVEEPDHWLWSSFRSYAFQEAGPVRVNHWQLLQMKIRPHVP